MRNLIAFISKNSYFFLFLFFEVFSFSFLFRNNHFQRTAFFNSTNAISGNIYEQYSNLTDYFSLREVNQQLHEENQALRNKQLRTYRKLFARNIMVNDTVYEQKYLYKEAEVINNSVNNQNNYITLNIGALNGVESGMGVLGISGVVGVVKNVSDRYASVLSVLHLSASISSKLKNTDYIGSIQWDGINYREGILKDIPNHVDLKKGDTVVTSGYSAIFPEGVPVAIIKDVEEPEGENFYSIKVQFINDFKKLSKVYVVKNIYQEEQHLIESKGVKDD